MNRAIGMSLRLAGLLWLFGLLAACATPPQLASTRRDAALTEYGAAIRWSEFEQALAFIDPAVRARQPMTELERERLKQVQVTGYEVKDHAVSADGSLTQTVEIRVVNKHTQVERVVTDHQTWRWDEAAKQLWLSSGLPDFSVR